MEYQNKLSRLRHAFLKLQGQDLTQVLLRDAAKRAEFVAHNVYTTEEIFHAIKDKIYEATNELSYNTKFELVSDLESLTILKKELIEDTVQEFEWEETLFLLLEGLDERDTKLIEQLLRNQHTYILESSKWNQHSSSAAMGGFTKLLVPITRRIFADFPARNLVGIQPMASPVGLTYTLQYKVEDKETGEQKTLGNFSDAQGTTGTRMSLEVISSAIEARTQRLAASMTIEAMDDIGSMRGLDIEAELVAALAQEIRHEINSEIIYDLKHLGGETIEVVKLDGPKKDQDLQLGCAIRRQSSGIAMRTRRGAGNFVVTSATIADIISKFSKSEFVPKLHPEGYTSDLMEVGTLNGTITVFSATNVAEDEILVGYKGVSSEVDTGYVYCPYIPVMSSGIVVHPKTFEPIVRLMTRGGKQSTKKVEDYYSNIKVEGLPKPKKE